MIGSLLYLTTTRLDIQFAVSLCARYQASPRTSHRQAVKRIFRVHGAKACEGGFGGFGSKPPPKLPKPCTPSNRAAVSPIQLKSSKTSEMGIPKDMLGAEPELSRPSSQPPKTWRDKKMHHKYE
ncbi:hypothetical protein U9M48_013366 [Paspalum notatum var. saurae]|uniref:Uncharacterized protein n=1 Tax=Paspalum notatum var. saurae TaxID=547442 RepID=A0AAQ3T242_PASNO